MRAGTVKQAAMIGVAVLLLLGPAPADPSDDLAGPAAGTGAGGGSTDKDSDFDNVEIVDSVLANKIELMRIGSQRGSNNLLGVFAGLRNKTAHRLELEIETIYKDQAGNDLNTGSWIHFTLEPHAEQDYRSAAISEAAVDFLVRVRRARAH
jgi:hypothetical protein